MIADRPKWFSFYEANKIAKRLNTERQGLEPVYKVVQFTGTPKRDPSSWTIVGYKNAAFHPIDFLGYHQEEPHPMKDRTKEQLIEDLEDAEEHAQALLNQISEKNRTINNRERAIDYRDERIAALVEQMARVREEAKAEQTTQAARITSLAQIAADRKKWIDHLEWQAIRNGEELARETGKALAWRDETKKQARQITEQADQIAALEFQNSLLTQIALDAEEAAEELTAAIHKIESIAANI